jgi:hypothetical protein
LSGAASTQRAALLAMSEEKCISATSLVSTSCACGSGAATRRIGSSGKNGVPSGIASTSPVKRSARSQSMKRASNPGRAASQDSSSELKRRFSRYSSAGWSPAARKKLRLGGSLRTKNSNTPVCRMPSSKYDFSIVSW